MEISRFQMKHLVYYILTPLSNKMHILNEAGIMHLIQANCWAAPGAPLKALNSNLSIPHNKIATYVSAPIEKNFGSLYIFGV